MEEVKNGWDALEEAISIFRRYEPSLWSPFNCSYIRY